jgi:hypothetical protein
MRVWQHCNVLSLLLVFGQLLVTWAVELPSALVLSPYSGFYRDGPASFPQLIPKHQPCLGMIHYLCECGLLGPAQWVELIGNASAVWLTSLALWQTAARWAGTKAGWIAAAIWLLNPLTAPWTRYAHTDPPFYTP